MIYIVDRDIVTSVFNDNISCVNGLDKRARELTPLVSAYCAGDLSPFFRSDISYGH